MAHGIDADGALLVDDADGHRTAHRTGSLTFADCGACACSSTFDVGNSETTIGLFDGDALRGALAHHDRRRRAPPTSWACCCAACSPVRTFRWRR